MSKKTKIGLAVGGVAVRAAEAGLVFWVFRLGHLWIQTRIGMMT